MDGVDRGEHQQSRRRALDRLRAARVGGVHQLLRPAALDAAGRRHGAVADDDADHHHRQPGGLESGAAVDPRSRPRRRRLQGADGVSSCRAAGDAGHDDRRHPRHGARDWRNGAAADDRHGRFHRRYPQRAAGCGDGDAGADFPVVGRARAGIRRTVLGGNTYSPRVLGGDEPARCLTAQAVRTKVVEGRPDRCGRADHEYGTTAGNNTPQIAGGHVRYQHRQVQDRQCERVLRRQAGAEGCQPGHLPESGHGTDRTLRLRQIDVPALPQQDE